MAETNQLLAAALNDLGVRPDPVLSERLHLWTSGHPYWTQLLASNLESPAKTPTERLLRELINHLLETEDRNLPHVFGSLEREGERLGSLIVSLLDGKPVSFSRSHAPVAKLELIGILKNNQGRCAFRNQIYQEAMQRHFERAALPRLGRIGAQNETSPANKSTIDLSGGLRTGALLKGRYLVEGELGRGGQGVTYLARDQQLYSRPVVVKVLVERSDPQFWRQARFREEIEALALIDNPGVVGVFDADALPDGRPFLVMQFVEGATLRFRLKEGGMDLKEVAGISRQVGQALNAAHNKGVWHCDLKPENIMVQILSEGNEAVKLIDFGLARVRDSHLDGGSGGRGLAGTIPYMAPEQLEQKPPSALTDIYSFGVIVFEMLTGRRPFHANSLDQLLALQRSGAVALCRDVPETARKLILQALSFNPQQRPSHARDFGNLMATALISHPSARKKSTTG